MKRFMKIVLLTLMAALCVASLAMSVAGATPNGASGVNFFALDTGTYDVQVETDETSYNNIQVGKLSDFSASYNPLVSNISWSLGNVSNMTNVQVRIYTNDTNSRKLFRYVAGGHNYYFVSATLRYYDANGTMYFVSPDRVTFYDMDGNVAYNGALYHGQTISNPQVDIRYVEFSFPTETITTSIESMRIENLVLLQEVSIQRPSNPNWVQTIYVPYNPAWFDNYVDDVDYQEGYEDGYQAGAIDAGGQPMQKWSAFLLAGVTGFLDFEIFPGMPLWGLLAVMVAIPLVLTCLKYFAGG